MASKSKIVTILKKKSANEISELFEVIAHFALANGDFDIYSDNSDDNIIPVVEDELSVKIDFNDDDFTEQKIFDILVKLLEAEMSEKKVTKSVKIELIASVLSNPLLFESFCLTFPGNEDDLHYICSDLGCEESYLDIINDEVFNKRKAYLNLIRRYTLAAVNLYGVLSVGFIEILMSHYEYNAPNPSDYVKARGVYKQTVLFNPGYRGVTTLQRIIGNLVSEILITLDGLIIHESFFYDFMNEREEMLAYFAEMGSPSSTDDLDAFFTSVMNKTSYRRLFEEASYKGPYLPRTKEIFLSYEDADFREISKEEKEFKNYLWKNYKSKFSIVGNKLDLSGKEVLEDYMSEMHDIISDYSEPDFDYDPNHFIQYLLRTLESHGISFKDMDDINKVLGLAMNFANSVRLWSNFGHSPVEVARNTAITPQNTTLVPGSSHAAELLFESKKELEGHGFNIDVDASATTIPIMHFAEGINSSSSVSHKKVYPNDPCPCGSGNKFKRCCGR